MRIVLLLALCLTAACGSRLQKPDGERWSAVAIKRSDAGTPERMEGRIYTVRRAERVADELSALVKKEKAIFKLLKPAKELSVTRDETDELGFRHLTMQRIHGGVPLWGETLHFHINKEGDLYLFHGAYSPSLSKFKVKNSLTGAQAEERAKAALGKTVALPAETKMWILMTQSGPKTVWRTVVGSALLSADQLECLIDANSGEVLYQASLLRP